MAESTWANDLYQDTSVQAATYDIAFPQEYVGTALVKNGTLREHTYAAHKDEIENCLFIAGFHLTGTGKAVPPPEDNAVLPAWRDALVHVIVGNGWSSDANWETIHNSSLYATSWMDVLRDIAPNSGAYMSEALYALKQEYDPTGLFYALTAVGAEDWEVQTTDPLPYSWNDNGRLCPVSS
ncbi:hypothetical protein BDV29DRAFT_153465 [Aspergillus leporis]|uniref:Berberine/berberine-like domain-containing protein n=1 Tax=Aspergillus leporis TaxID=41062 RepID=A0A5N5XA15_9EURO|nr:hypothetical protein BDV29DRAFT_153465 [Aspergillus leporis]